jgi:predicted pyridoxine 5'-phosphate oxidase superfamily flavin-nucleotide-binding protein
LPHGYRIEPGHLMVCSFQVQRGKHSGGSIAMPESVMFHEGNRQLQDRFDSRRISDRLEEKLTRKEFTADDKAFIESLPYFFLATSDDKGRPDCSFKGGPPGFVRITGPSEIAFPDYDGNGMFKSLGNILVNADVGLLFIAMHGKPKRLRVNGRASVSDRDPLLAETVGAQLIVRVTARAIFPNCPRYIPTVQSIEPSVYTPRAGQDAPEPAWKGFADFKDCIHPRQPTFKG